MLGKGWDQMNGSCQVWAVREHQSFSGEVRGAGPAIPFYLRPRAQHWPGT
jgi:hypothetical protein